MSIPGDNPIHKESEDALGRYPIAQSFVSQALHLDASSGAVVGVLGPWGSGKTSFINFARKGFSEQGITVLDFNPWMFSGAEQLVDSFFIELSAQLRDNRSPDLEAVAEALSDYGEAFSGLAWLPVVGPWVERSRGVAKYLSKLLSRRQEGIEGKKATLEQSLARLDKPIVVVLDDIDRLDPDEIRDVFKLVRLIASLPNVVYVLSFDRKRVEQALDSQGISGRDYLEKIVQVMNDLPQPPREALLRQIDESINLALAEIDAVGPFDEKAWPDIAIEVVLPLVRTMRDVRRYAASVYGTVLSLGGKIALQDLLAVEAIRVFLPDTFSLMAGSVGALTEARGSFSDSAEPKNKTQIEALVASAEPRDAVMKSAIHRVFFSAERHVGGVNYGEASMRSWLAERRLAHEQVLRLYFERVQGEQLTAFESAELIWKDFPDADRLESAIEEIPLARREDVIRELESFESQFRAEHVVPGVVVLLNQWPKLPDRPRGLLDFDARLTVSRVVYRLVRSLKDPQAIVGAVREALPRIQTLAGQFELITDVGYREGAGHQLVTEQDAAEIENEWAERVRATGIDELLGEHDLLRTLYWADEILAKSGSGLDVDADPRLTLQLLRTARTYTRTQNMSERVPRMSLRLAWDTFETLLGGEKVAEERIKAINRSSLDEQDNETLQLADRYLTGWRPPEFSDFESEDDE